ncbi:MAG: DUF1648 domain-containing protein [Candidatus Aenigmarchaeota archaeon]|nr:DUF1648 domain-containing protein [Candidatus Aenigmarchaeota archaeon]
MKTATAISLALIILSFIIGIYIYPQMPASMASHWNAQGIVDGYMSKFWGLFLMPVISVFLFLLFLAIPRIDPMKKNIQKFRKYFDIFIMIIIAFLLYLYSLTILWSLGFKFSMIFMLLPAFAILFYYAGILTENAKRNWFIGIRTPWTLSNDKVWDKTHKLGGLLFKLCGIIALFGMLLPDYALLFVIIPAVVLAIYTVVYSYFEYQKIKR